MRDKKSRTGVTGQSVYSCDLVSLQVLERVPVCRLSKTLDLHLGPSDRNSSNKACRQRWGSPLCLYLYLCILLHSYLLIVVITVITFLIDTRKVWHWHFNTLTIYVKCVDFSRTYASRRWKGINSAEMLRWLNYTVRRRLYDERLRNKRRLASLVVPSVETGTENQSKITNSTRLRGSGLYRDR